MFKKLRRFISTLLGDSQAEYRRGFGNCMADYFIDRQPIHTIWDDFEYNKGLPNPHYDHGYRDGLLQLDSMEVKLATLKGYQKAHGNKPRIVRT